MALLGASGTGTVAVGVTVVATLVIVALGFALLAVLRAVRDLRAAAEDLRRESASLVAAVDGTLAHAGTELERVEDLIGSAERLARTVGGASDLAYASVASPVIKLLAFSRGTARASRRLRDGSTARGGRPDSTARGGRPDGTGRTDGTERTNDTVADIQADSRR